MKTLLTLVASSLLVGCAVGSFPKFPEQIKNHYVVDIATQDLPAGIFYSNNIAEVSQESVDFLDAITNIQEIPEMKVTEVARCLKFEIVQKIPYKIKYLSQVALNECNLVGGYKPEDSVSLYNWFEQVVAWAEDRKHCFKK